MIDSGITLNDNNGGLGSRKPAMLTMSLTSSYWMPFVVFWSTKLASVPQLRQLSARSLDPVASMTPKDEVISLASRRVDHVSILHKDAVHSGFHLVAVLQKLPSSIHVLTTDARIAALHLDNFTAEFQSKPSFLLVKLRKAENARPKSRTISSVTHVQGTLFSFKPSVKVLLVITLPAHSCGRWRKDCDTPMAKPHRRCMAAFLATLPIGEFFKRLAEVLKITVIWNKDDFALLESRSQEIFETIQTPSRTTPGGLSRLKSSGSIKKTVLLARVGETVDEKAAVEADDTIRRTLSEAIRVIPDIPKTGFSPCCLRTGNMQVEESLAFRRYPGHDGRLKRSQGCQILMGGQLVVEDGRGALETPESGKETYLGNADTTARFLTTVCALAKSRSSKQTSIITGNARMKQRIGPLVDGLRENGASISYLESQVNMSRPFCSAHLMRPELAGGQVISQPNIDTTIAMMCAFGADIKREAGKDIYHTERGVYRNPSEYAIESDASRDARFAKKGLKPMGCTVVQTETETTITGPKEGLRAGGLIEVEPMTDAFLTASVLASVATRPAFPERRVEGNETITRIIAIANQRVKECNVVKAMTDELASLQQVSKGLIEEKRCVEKTGPTGGMDDLHNKLGISVEGADLEKASGSGSQTPMIPLHLCSLLACAALGNSTLLILLGRLLIGKLSTADSVFAQKVRNIKEFVKEKGWEAFRVAETQSKNCIISLSGGIVESPEVRDLLKDYVKNKGPVVNVFRREDTVVAYFKQYVTRPAYGESVRDVFRRRKPWYEECSSHKFIDCMTGSLDSWTQFHGVLSRTLTRSPQALEELSYGSDAIEPRVDLLSEDGNATAPNVPSLGYVAAQVVALRRNTLLPIIYTSGNMRWDGADVRENQDYRQGQGLPHRYGRYETEVIDGKIKAILKLPDFGGASVTILLKLDIVPLSDEVSPDTKLIGAGAVNTIIVRTAEDGTRTLYGDNLTGWALPLAQRTTVEMYQVAGATTIYLYNRTRSTAEKLAKHFPSDYNINRQRHPYFTSKSGGIITDMAYRPAPTLLIRVAQSVRRPEWRATEGNGGLLEQGYRSVQSMDNYEGASWHYSADASALIGGPKSSIKSPNIDAAASNVASSSSCLLYLSPLLRTPTAILPHLTPPSLLSFLRHLPQHQTRPRALRNNNLAP
ncbi:hypothetical protein M422DRAFT_257695 [Sphaerobolus stellatus SS14]|uniref:Enolpyruvate transferase domain-containing protein n=1 Tax=Sphaerobolus stellatus (strain SS14) TaxID=990650 RepID=A0A0C9UX12_SPHS4|nr:hypothetical protein M422DRAFT_257695 [Sphaerobolus stellatus SS14]